MHFDQTANKALKRATQPGLNSSNVAWLTKTPFKILQLYKTVKQ